MNQRIENIVERESNIQSYPNPGTKIFEYGTSGIRYKWVYGSSVLQDQNQYDPISVLNIWIMSCTGWECWLLYGPCIWNRPQSD